MIRLLADPTAIARAREIGCDANGGTDFTFRC